MDNLHVWKAFFRGVIKAASLRTTRHLWWRLDIKSQNMGFPVLGMLLIASGLSGCAAFEASSHRVSTNESNPILVNGRETRVRPLASLNSADGTTRFDPIPATPEHVRPPPLTAQQPDAIIKIESSRGRLTPEMDGRLAQVIDQAGQDDRTLFRLESYVPPGGSPSLDIGKAERALQIVRERMLALGVSPRRILTSSFGAEHDQTRDTQRHWVEIYLIRTGAESPPPSPSRTK